jgi:hypothetical protein
MATMTASFVMAGLSTIKHQVAFDCTQVIALFLLLPVNAMFFCDMLSKPG